MNILKKILRYLAYTLVGLLIAGVLLPFVFKNKLLGYLRQELNRTISAEVNFADASLSLISSFPDVRITIDSLSLMGTGDFNDILLYKADKTEVDISIPSLLGKNSIPEIKSLELNRPEVNIVVLDSLKANYLISKDTSTQKRNFKFKLDHYRLKDGKMTYQDNTFPLYLVMNGINHEGAGNFTQDIFDLTTSTEVSELSVKYKGTGYVNKAKAALQAKIQINMPEDKYTIRENTLKINELEVSADGFIQYKGKDMISDITFKTASEDFRSFLSIVPNAFISNFKEVKASGYASIAGHVNGIYNATSHMMPAFNIAVLIKNGYAKYPSLPRDIRDVQADITIKATKPDYKDMSVDIPTFSLKLGDDAVNGRLVASHLSGNQKIEGFLKGNMNLKSIKEAFPVEGLEELSGHIVCNVAFSANMEDVNHENYKAISFTGSADANHITYKSAGRPAIRIDNASLKANPGQLLFSGINMRAGRSDLDLTLDVSNPLAFFSTQKSMKINILASSNLLDINEWNPESSAMTREKENQAVPFMAENNLVKNSSVTLKWKADKVLIHQMIISKLSMDALLSANAVKINDLTARLQENNMKISGSVINGFDYLFNHGILDGNISFYADKLDLNEYMVADKTAPATGKVIPVPENVRLKMDANIQDLVYTNLHLKSFHGELEIKDREAALKNLKTETLGGMMRMEGVYNTNDLSHPGFSVKLDLSKIKFVEAISKIDLFRKAAPVAAYVNGIFNTTLIMKGKLGDHMMPELSTLDASGFLETLNGSLKGFKPLSDLADKLGIKEIREYSLENTRNWFEIVDGTVELKEIKKVIKGVETTISGRHGFGKEMDYDIDMVIPRELIKQNKWIGSVEQGLSMLEKEAANLGIDIHQGPNIYLHIKMTGSIKNPSFKITPKSGKGTSAQDALTSSINEQIRKAKDSITHEMNKKVAQLQDTMTKRSAKELEKIKAKAEEAVQKELDSIRSKAKAGVIQQIDTLTKGMIPDSVKQKAKDILEKNAGKEVEKIKDKLKDFNPFKKKGNGRP